MHCIGKPASIKMAAPAANPHQAAHTALVTAPRGCLEKEDVYGDELVDIANIVVFVDLSTSTPLIHCMSWSDLRSTIISPNTTPQDRVRFWRAEPIPSNYVYHVHDRWYDPMLEPLTRYYNTFVYTGSYDAEVGTYYAVSALHGATERLHRVRPVHRADVVAYVREEIDAAELRRRLQETAGVRDGATTPVTFRPRPEDTILPDALLTERRLLITRLAGGRPFGLTEQWQRGGAEAYRIFDGEEPMVADAAPAAAAAAAAPAPSAAPRVSSARRQAAIDAAIRSMDRAFQEAAGRLGVEAPRSRSWLLRREDIQGGGAAPVGPMIDPSLLGVPPSPQLPAPPRDEVAPAPVANEVAQGPPLRYMVQIPGASDPSGVSLSPLGQVVSDIRSDEERANWSLFFEELVVRRVGGAVPTTLHVWVRPEGEAGVVAVTAEPEEGGLAPYDIDRWRRYFQRELLSRPPVARIMQEGTRVILLNGRPGGGDVPARDATIDVWKWHGRYYYITNGYHAPMPVLYRGVLDFRQQPDGPQRRLLLSPSGEPYFYEYMPQQCRFQMALLLGSAEVQALIASQSHYYRRTPPAHLYLTHGATTFVQAAGAYYSLQDGNEYVPVAGGAEHVQLSIGRQRWQYHLATRRLLHENQPVAAIPPPLQETLALLATQPSFSVDYGTPELAIAVRQVGRELYYSATLPADSTASGARSRWEPVLLTRSAYITMHGQHTHVLLPTVLPDHWAELRDQLPGGLSALYYTLLERQFDRYWAAVSAATGTGFTLEDMDAGGDMLEVRMTDDQLVYADILDGTIVSPPDLSWPTIYLVHQYDGNVQFIRTAYGAFVPHVDGGLDAFPPAARASFNELWRLLDNGAAAIYPYTTGCLMPGALVYGDVHIFPWREEYVAVDVRRGEGVALPDVAQGDESVIGAPADVAAYVRYRGAVPAVA